MIFFCFHIGLISNSNNRKRDENRKKNKKYLLKTVFLFLYKYVNPAIIIEKINANKTSSKLVVNIYYSLSKFYRITKIILIINYPI